MDDAHFYSAAVLEPNASAHGVQSSADDKSDWQDQPGRMCGHYVAVVSQCWFIKAWSRYFVELLSRLVRQLTISFHTLLCMTSHVIRP